MCLGDIVFVFPLYIRCIDTVHVALVYVVCRFYFQHVFAVVDAKCELVVLYMDLQMAISIHQE
jgi:hypothetical protein